MKFTCILALVLFSISMSGVDGEIESFSLEGTGQSGGTDDYTITVVNTFQPPNNNNIRGLDFSEPNSIFYINGTDLKFYQCSADDGSYESDWDLDPGNPNPYCMVDSYTYANVNDYTGSSIFFFDGGSWGTYTNPAGSDGRGMDYDGTYIWEAYSSGGTFGVYQFDDSGTVIGSWTLPEVPTQLSGLAVFPSGGNVGIAVTCYNTHNMYLYEYDGSMNYLGMGPLPSLASSSLGLCYSENRGTFFWSYNSAGGYTITELQVTEQALESDTWGAIKTHF